MPQFFLPSENHRSSTQRDIFINARIIDPETGYDKLGYLVVEGDKILDFGNVLTAEFQNSSTGSDDNIIDCQGKILCPGLIDIQVHFRDPGLEHKEDINSGSKSAVAGGVTTVVCQPNTSPVIDNIIVVEYIKNKAKETAYNNVKMYAAITRDMKGKTITDMGLLLEAGVVGFTDDGLPVSDSLMMRKALEYASNFNTVVAQHAEDLSLTDGGCMNEGIVSTELGVKGIPNISESIIVERDIAILEVTGGHYHVLHVSTKEALDAIRRGKAKGLNITAEASPHHFTLTDEAVRGYNSFAKMNPPLRSERDRLAIIEGLKDGSLDAIATDHAPHDIASKQKPLSEASFGIVGLETMLPLALELYHHGHMGLVDVLKKMTCNAADIIKIDAGRIAKGKIADLVLFDPDAQWEIDISKFSSKSHNSPFGGRKVKGKVLRTIVGGKSVYIDSE